MDARTMERSLLDLNARITELNRRVLDLEDQNDSMKVSSELLAARVQTLESENRALRDVPLIQAPAETAEETSQSGLATDVAALKLALAAVRAEVAQNRAAKRDEKYYQRLLERELGSGHLHIAGVGTTDITTPEAHVEIKRWSDADKVIGQLAKYNNALPRQRNCAYFFGPKPCTKRVGDIFNILRAAGIEMYHIDEFDVIHRHELTEGDASNSLRENVRNFVSDHLFRSTNPDKVLLWKDVHNRYKPLYAKVRGPILQDELRLQGVRYVETSRNGLKFEGFLGWELRPLVSSQ
jgi:hypothetical protein